MNISHVEKMYVEEERVDDTLCNKCGKSIYLYDKFTYSGTELCSAFGYGSNKDGLTEYFHLCDDCYDNLILSFKYRPQEI